MQIRYENTITWEIMYRGILPNAGTQRIRRGG